MFCDAQLCKNVFNYHGVESQELKRLSMPMHPL